MSFFSRIFKRTKFRKEFIKHSQELADGRFLCRWEDRWPCTNDATDATFFDAHYLYHTAWAARLLNDMQPRKHVDIGSCLRFNSIVSAFVPIDFYDYRLPAISLPGLTCGRADLLKLSFESDSIESLSCMHVVEHVGLMRYGDSFDPQGDLKAIKELCRVVAKGGHLFFVVPVGNIARIQYNAHRIYTYRQVVEYFAQESLRLNDFSLVTDLGVFILSATESDAGSQRYGCGCFHFIKKDS